MKKILLLSFLSLVADVCKADNWEYVKDSGLYYYGVGVGATQEEASTAAWAELMNSIVVNVKGGFDLLESEDTHNGNVVSKTKMLNCVKTYSHGTFTNVETLVEGKAPNIVVKKYFKREEMSHVYENRMDLAREWTEVADDHLEKRKIDIALQYYYWAYALVRSLQYPHEATDSQGRKLSTILPLKLRDVLGKIEVKYESQDEDYVSLIFTYNGKPVSNLSFSYNDGQAENHGCKAQDGCGCLEMQAGYENSQVFHVAIEYDYKSQARGDAEMSGILDVVPVSFFREAIHEVKRSGNTSVASRKSEPAKPVIIDATKKVPPVSDVKDNITLGVKPAQQPDNLEVYAKAMTRVVDAIGRKASETSLIDLFDAEGMDVYKKVMNYGNARLIGSQNLTFFKGPDGTVTARGVQMSFSFTSPKRATFTENLVFTFNKEGKICNVAFGLGTVAENDILCRNVDWGEEVKETIMEFLENYKTAYCLKRHDFISDIFADDAVIIIGKVTHVSGTTTRIGEHDVTQVGRDIITNNRYDKTQYLKKLKDCFGNPRNKYINLRFANNDIQSLKSFGDRKVFGIQIKQFYDSATYGDEGYLFLMVDITDPDRPQIKVRTWQPIQTPSDKLYNAGNFYKSI